jgi:hypothetical protein
MALPLTKTTSEGNEMMGLPSTASSHHTVWVGPPGDVPHPVRYAVDGDRLVCFGDDALAGIPDGTRVTAAIHEIAGGPAVASFGGSLQHLAPKEVPGEALLELLAHVPLGRDLDEVQASLSRVRAGRRIVAIVA